MNDPSLSLQLRARTADMHARAEKHPVQQDLVRGKASGAAYARWLAAMRWVHEVFESRLARAAAADPVVGELVKPHHYRVALIDEDLTALGGSLHPPKGEAIVSEDSRARWRRIDAAAEEDPSSILGVFYVLEGSTNGGFFIAKAVRKSFSFSGAAGTRYLDPHGELVRQRWQEARASLDAADLTSERRERVVRSAEATFELICAIMDDVAAQPAPAV